MDLNISNEAAVILVLGAFAITCIHWAGRLFYLAMSR